MTKDPSSLVYQLASRNLGFSESANDWLLPMLPSNTKTSLDTQIGCAKCLGYQSLKDLEMER